MRLVLPSSSTSCCRSSTASLASGQHRRVDHAEQIIFGALIVWFLIVEPHGHQPSCWSVGKQSCACVHFHTKSSSRSFPPSNFQQETIHGLRQIALATSVAAAGLVSVLAPATASAQAKGSSSPCCRTAPAPTPPNGVPGPTAADYLKLVNTRDGGIPAA